MLLHGLVVEHNVRIKKALPARPLDWLAHITQSCPDNLAPAIVMNIPRVNYAASLLVVDADKWLLRKAIVLSARENEGG
jgi:hypothetical protein